MRKIIKIILTLITIVLLIYIGYRNIALRKIPSVDLIKDESTISLYHNLLPNTSNNIWTNYYYSHSSVTNEELPIEIKYNIAYKNLRVTTQTIKEEDLKKTFENIFGTNTYKKIDTFIGGCNTYNYNEISNVFEKMTQDNCISSDMYILSKIVDANYDDQKMEITVIIAYVDKLKKIIYKDCDQEMKNCQNEIVKRFTEFDEADLNEKKYNLHKYRFTYKNEKDKYSFQSVEKIK